MSVSVGFTDSLLVSNAAIRCLGRRAQLLLAGRRGKQEEDGERLVRV